MLRFTIGTAIFVATLVAIMIRPYRVPEAVTALIASALMVIGGFVAPVTALRTLGAEWNVYGFFLVLMMIAALADQAGIFEALAAAQAAGLATQTRLERGKPEQVIVTLARETGMNLIAIGARQNPEHHPPLGPGSVGHTARFVLDHAPCDVLLVRTLASA